MTIVRQKAPAQARTTAILRRLNDGGSVAVADLARELDVSDMTIRRDLAGLERAGLLERVHGGAVLPAGGPLRVIDDVEPTFEARAAHNRDLKARIAAEAAAVLSRFRTIAMDVGTSTMMTAEFLAGRSIGAGRRVFTNSLRIAERLSDAGAEVYTPGGRVRPDERSIMGPSAVEQFSQLYFDAAVLGVSGLTAEGLYDYSVEDTEMKQVYLARSARRILLCDSSKFRRLSTIRVCGLDAITTLITDAAPPPDIASALAAAGVELRVARG